MTYYRQLKCAKRNLDTAIEYFDRAMIHFKASNTTVDAPKEHMFMTDECMDYMKDAGKALQGIKQELEGHLGESSASTKTRS